MRCRVLFIAATVVVNSASALAQGAPAPPPRAPVETVVVTGTATGPAIWHAMKDGADVAILGIVQPLPDRFVWNTRPLAAMLKDAHRVLLPPQVRMGVFSGVWFYLTQSDLLHPPGGRTLWDILDPAAAAALTRACAFLREPRERYSDDSPIFAAMRLGSDFRHVEYLTTHEPEDTITALARAAHVPTHSIATYDLVPSGEDLLKLPATLTGRCIEAEVQDIDFQARHVHAAANSWAVGDVAGMLANWAPSQYYDCLVRLSQHATALDARSIADTAGAIGDALGDGGHALAVVDIGLLLRRGGVLDRLKTEGVSVTGPQG